MANPITNLPLPPNLLTHLSDLSNLTNPNSTTLPNTSTSTSKTTSISPKTTIILLTITLGIPTLLIIIFSTIHYISLRLQKRKSPTNPSINPSPNTNPPNNGPILPLDARNMGILGRQINPEDEIELDFIPGYRRYGSWESVSSSILSTLSSRMGAAGLEGGEVSPLPPPPYVEREGERERERERDVEVEVGNGGGVGVWEGTEVEEVAGDGIVVVPPPVYHPLM